MASWLVAGFGAYAVSASPFSSRQQPAESASLGRRQFPHGEHPLGFNHNWAEVSDEMRGMLKRIRVPKYCEIKTCSTLTTSLLADDSQPGPRVAGLLRFLQVRQAHPAASSSRPGRLPGRGPRPCGTC